MPNKTNRVALPGLPPVYSGTADTLAALELVRELAALAVARAALASSVSIARSVRW